MHDSMRPGVNNEGTRLHYGALSTIEHRNEKNIYVRGTTVGRPDFTTDVEDMLSIMDFCGFYGTRRLRHYGGFIPIKESDLALGEDEYDKLRFHQA